MNKDIIIFDLLSQESASNLEKIFLEPSFPWYWNNLSSPELDASSFQNNNIIDTPQLTHMICYNGEFQSSLFPILQPLIKDLETLINFYTSSIFRIKANLLWQSSLSSKSKFHPPHTDTIIDLENTYTMIYYVNDSDGDTRLFDCFYPSNFKNNKIIKIKPEKGKCVFFNSARYHSSANPINLDKRIVINFLLNGKFKND
jgi:hypothetical protein